MDIGIIIAIAGSTVAIIGVVISMMFWVRNESNSLRTDQKEDRIGFMQAREEDRKEMFQIIRSIESCFSEMKLENRDFHHRLLEIERKRKN